MTESYQGVVGSSPTRGFSGQMAITNIVLTYSIIAGVFSALLFILTLFFEKDKKKSRKLVLWAVLFLASSFAMSEYAFWLEGYNLFELVFNFNFPLIVYFGVWFAFIVWLFETRKERKIWIMLLALLAIVVLLATNCMNCIRF